MRTWGRLRQSDDEKEREPDKSITSPVELSIHLARGQDHRDWDTVKTLWGIDEEQPGGGHRSLNIANSASGGCPVPPPAGRGLSQA